MESPKNEPNAGIDRTSLGVQSPSSEEKDDSGHVQQRVFLSVMEAMNPVLARNE